MLHDLGTCPTQLTSSLEHKTRTGQTTDQSRQDAVTILQVQTCTSGPASLLQLEERPKQGMSICC